MYRISHRAYLAPLPCLLEAEVLADGLDELLAAHQAELSIEARAAAPDAQPEELLDGPVADGADVIHRPWRWNDYAYLKWGYCTITCYI